MSLCSVIGCKSNKNHRIFVQTFQFPTEEPLRSAWIKAVSRPNWEPTPYSSVCKLHFLDVCFLPPTESSQRMTLLPNTVPTIFDKKRLHILEKHNEEMPIPKHKDDLILNFSNFALKVNKKINLNNWNYWNLYKGPKHVVLYILKRNNHFGCDFKIRIIINTDLEVKCFRGNTPEPLNKFENILPGNMKITLWSQLHELIALFNSEDNVNI